MNNQIFKQSYQSCNRNTIVKKKFSKEVTYSKLLIVHNIPKTVRIRQYYRTEHNMQFCIDPQDETCLGQMKTNIFSLGSKVNETIHKENGFLFLLTDRVYTPTPNEVVYDILERMGLNDCVLKIKAINQRYDHPQHTLQLQTDQNIKDFETRISLYPFEKYTFRMIPKGSVVQSHYINQEMLNYMGITIQMLEEHLKEYQTLPTMKRGGKSYIDVWRDTVIRLYNNQENFYSELTNYNGHYSRVNTSYKQLLYEREGSIYLNIYWIYDCATNDYLALQNEKMCIEESKPKKKICRYKQI